MSYKSPSPSSIMTLLLATLPFFYTHTHTHHVARVNNPDHPIIAHIFINHNHHHHHHFHHNNHHQQSSPCVSIDSQFHTHTHTHHVVRVNNSDHPIGWRPRCRTKLHSYEIQGWKDGHVRLRRSYGYVRSLYYVKRAHKKKTRFDDNR